MYLRTDEGGYNLAMVIDLSSLATMTAQLTCDALQMALWGRKQSRNAIVHTEPGGQYCSSDYQAFLSEMI